SIRLSVCPTRSVISSSSTPLMADSLPPVLPSTTSSSGTSALRCLRLSTREHSLSTIRWNQVENLLLPLKFLHIISALETLSLDIQLCSDCRSGNRCQQTL